ncbi:MAG TPA: TIGR00730 family Rossman fold protein [Acidimicrobiales bacterium]|nr:TIGR00730 family Rossman fold protein [Acidimicrobiales bacterium]
MLELADALIATSGVRRNRDLLREIVAATLGLAREEASRLDLKIARAALSEMANAFRIFAPFREVPKVTIFGSARTAPSDGLYTLTRELARRLAEKGCMVVTGAGPGIMAAGNEGAGRAMTIGVNIRLPFETEANSWIDVGDKLVEMKYFFTRKLMLMKESAGFLVLPGGFGTLDEAFELLTLLQTGKAEPAPIVLVDTPNGRYWSAWEEFVSGVVYARGLADAADASLYRITDDVDDAIEELLGFYRNYHSRRFVGETMVLRLHHAPSAVQLAELTERFADLCGTRGIYATDPLPPERADHDHLELARIALEFDRSRHSRLRQLIDALNALAPLHADELGSLPPSPTDEA